MVVAITGDPGTGKTTVCLKVVNILRRDYPDLKICGFITREIRESGRRTGFEMIDLLDDERDILAHVHYRSPVKVGKYSVNVHGVDRMSELVEAHLESSDVVVVDEIGPMELMSKKFRKLIVKVMKLDSALISVHKRSRDPLLLEIRKKIPPIEITADNRDAIPVKIADMVMKWK